MRLPASILPVGDVVITTPVGTGAIAPRLAYQPVRDPKALKRGGFQSAGHLEPGPACQDQATRIAKYNEGVRFAELSAGWVDKLGVVACPQCFTEEN